MGNNRMIVEERQRDIGQFMVGRLLPFRKKRQVGPFTFIDHMGPAEMGKGRYADVDQHPHIGLSTLTYLFEGAIEHRDSTGAVQRIEAGDVGFMTAGSGVAHTERTPEDMRGEDSFRMHGYQVWVAMPKEKEEMAPRFDFVAANDLPRWKENGLDFRLVAGEGFGRRSPLNVHSPLFMVDVLAESDSVFCPADALEGELALVVVKGEVIESDEGIGQGQMLISRTDTSCNIRISAGTRLLLFGGQPLGEERFMSWNFVSHSKERLEQARLDWEARRFPKVPGDETYIPFPTLRN